jgi:hypothetical protein
LSLCELLIEMDCSFFRKYRSANCETLKRGSCDDWNGNNCGGVNDDARAGKFRGNETQSRVIELTEAAE